MRIPFVIDNREHRLADILNELLARFEHRSLDIATAYFTVSGFRLLKDGLARIGSFRLLLGAEPMAADQVGLRPDAKAVSGHLRKDLEDSPFSEETLRLVEDLVAFLRRADVDVRVVEQRFLHAKCYLIYGDKPGGDRALFDRFQPLIGIVGSSNFTAPGLTGNRELNLAHRVLLDPEEGGDPAAGAMVSYLADERSSARITEKNRQLLKSEVGARAILELTNWYDREWSEARPFKDDLVALLDASKFGKQEYTPYQVYLKALFEYHKDDLAGLVETPGTRSAVELTEFQEAAVKRARSILARYDGVMVADSVGLGKTWIGKRLLEGFAYHQRQKALVVCPASLRDMWERELAEATISATILSQEELGQKGFNFADYADADMLLIDESHNFRNRHAQRFENLDTLIGLNGGRGRAGERKKVVLLTATPINNDLMDLYNQLTLVTRGDLGFFTSVGIGDLRRYFWAARQEKTVRGATAHLFNLLDEVVIRRTRAYIRQAYPEATIKGERVTFPDRRLKTVNYDLERTYAGIYEDIVARTEGLNLAPYSLEAYKKPGVQVNEWDLGREEALVGIFKSRYLKRLESSVEAFRISIRRALQFQKTFEEYLLGGRLFRSPDFHDVLRYVEDEGEEDDAVPKSVAEALDENEDAKAALAALPPVDPADYDLRRLHNAIQADIEALTGIWQRIEGVAKLGDAKRERLKELLAGPLRDQKVLLFTYYKDTARYLYRWFTGKEGQEFLASIGNPVIRRMDSGASPAERRRIVEHFAPQSNKRPDLVDSKDEIDILISTDVLSEGQNLQDCAHLVNYDLHWNPTRMVQRAGRIDRIGAKFDTLYIFNMFPDEGLERLLGLVERLSRKIHGIDKTGFLDASVLGETVHPRNFNTLRRIQAEDGAVVDEEEQAAELVSGEFLLGQLKAFLEREGRAFLEDIPDGIHSGLARPRKKGLFFHFKSKRPGGWQHYWKFYDAADDRIIDNRYVIANLIACQPDTPRVIGDLDVFAIQERVIEDILKSQKDRQALEAAPRTVDPLQSAVSTVVQGYLNHPGIERKDVLRALTFLGQPMSPVMIARLRAIHREHQRSPGAVALLSSLHELQEQFGTIQSAGPGQARPALTRDDLRLVCFEHICG